MIPLASGEADEQNIPTSQNVSICLTFLGLQLNSGLIQNEDWEHRLFFSSARFKVWKLDRHEHEASRCHRWLSQIR